MNDNICYNLNSSSNELPAIIYNEDFVIHASFFIILFHEHNFDV